MTAFDFVVPDEVAAEILRPEQREALEGALQRGLLRQESLTDLAAIDYFADLRAIMGRGEAACLAMAAAIGGLVACDERRAFRREALTRLGGGRLVTTAGLFVLAIRAGLLTVQQADQAKAVLEAKSFHMPFGSFKELIGDN